MEIVQSPYCILVQHKVISLPIRCKGLDHNPYQVTARAAVEDLNAQIMESEVSFWLLPTDRCVGYKFSRAQSKVGATIPMMIVVVDANGNPVTNVPIRIEISHSGNRYIKNDQGNIAQIL
jgi:hypothetical protein